MELKSDQSVRITVRVKDVEPGSVPLPSSLASTDGPPLCRTYVPFASVKLHFFANIGKPEWTVSWFEADEPVRHIAQQQWRLTVLAGRTESLLDEFVRDFAQERRVLRHGDHRWAYHRQDKEPRDH